MIWVALTGLIFLLLIAGILSSGWSVHRRASKRLRRLPARKRRRAGVAEYSIFGGNAVPGAGGFSGADGGGGGEGCADVGGGGDGAGCD